MGLFSNEINNNIGSYQLPSSINGTQTDGNKLFNNFLTNKNVEQDAVNGLTNTNTISDEIQNQAPSATSLADNNSGTGFNWLQFGQQALKDLGNSNSNGGGAAATQTPNVSFNPQQMQIQKAQTVQPVSYSTLGNIGKQQNLYNLLRG